MIDPVVVGGGKRVFRDDGALRSFRLVEGKVDDARRVPRDVCDEEGMGGVEPGAVFGG